MNPQLICLAGAEVAQNKTYDGSQGAIANVRVRDGQKGVEVLDGDAPGRMECVSVDSRSCVDSTGVQNWEVILSALRRFLIHSGGS